MGSSTELVTAKPNPSSCASAGSQNRVLWAFRGSASTGSGLKHQYLSFKRRKKPLMCWEGWFMGCDFMVYVNQDGASCDAAKLGQGCVETCSPGGSVGSPGARRKRFPQTHTCWVGRRLGLCHLFQEALSGRALCLGLICRAELCDVSVSHGSNMRVYGMIFTHSVPADVPTSASVAAAPPRALCLFSVLFPLFQSSQSCSSGRQNHARLQSDSSSSTQVSSSPLSPVPPQAGAGHRSMTTVVSGGGECLPAPPVPPSSEPRSAGGG